MIKGVIFDLDGTIGDTLPVCFEAFRRVFDQYLGVTHTDAEIRAMFGPTEEGILIQRLPDASGAAIARYHEVYAAVHHLAPQPFPGLVDILDWLEAAAVPVGIVTGKGARSAATSLQEWGIEHRFDPIEAGSDEGPVKDAKMRLIAERWGIPTSAVVSVGDVLTDITAARTVGAVPIGAAWATTTDADELRAGGAEAVFTEVGDLDRWLQAAISPSAPGPSSAGATSAGNASARPGSGDRRLS